MHPIFPMKDLQSISLADELPTLPKGSYCTWSFDKESRVLLANFRNITSPQPAVITPQDEQFLLKMMERDDITVISEGLVDDITSSIWSRDFIEGCIGSVYHHQIRAFKKTPRNVATATNEQRPSSTAAAAAAATTTNNDVHYEEQDDWYSMQFSSFFDYLEMSRNAQENMWKEGGVNDNGRTSRRNHSEIFSFTDCDGQEHRIDPLQTSLVSVNPPQSEDDCSFLST